METVKTPLNQIEPGAVILITDETVKGSRDYLQDHHKGPAIFKSVSDIGMGQALAYVDIEGQGFGTFSLRGPTKGTIEVLKGKAEKKVLDKRIEMLPKSPFKVSGIGMTIGSDPELFVVGEKTGRVIPAWEYLADRKKSPTVYWDGFQAEFNTAPASCLVVHTKWLQLGVGKVMAKARAQFPRCKISPYSTVPVDTKVLESLEDKYVEFGCMPSINVYGEPEMARPDARSIPVRFAGGHIHAGMSYTEQMLLPMIAAADAVVGVAGVAMARNFDDPIRRRFYGRAGEIRRPKHGIEYRVLSNFWLHHPALAHLVYELFRVSLRFGASGYHKLLWKTPQDEVRRIINECDVKAAVVSLRQNEKTLEDLIKQTNIRSGFSLAPYALKWALKAIFEGMESVLPDDTIYQNWMSSAAMEGNMTWAWWTNLLEQKGVQTAKAEGKK